jgi:hypothetical protein
MNLLLYTGNYRVSLFNSFRDVATEGQAAHFTLSGADTGKRSGLKQIRYLIIEVLLKVQVEEFPNNCKKCPRNPNRLHDDTACCKEGDQLVIKSKSSTVNRIKGRSASIAY